MSADAIPLKKRLLRLIASRHRWRILLGALLGFLIFVQLVAFSPTRLEKDLPPQTLTEEKILEEVAETTQTQETPALAIPKVVIPAGQVPEYSVDGFQFVSIQAGVKQWRIEAEHAFFYQKQGFVHAKTVKAEIYDTSGAITHVLAGEAKYALNSRDLELFTDVTSRFTTVNLTTKSPYMKYDAKTREVLIPTQVPLEGLSPGDATHEEFAFWSHGLVAHQSKMTARLLSRVRVEARKTTSKGELEVTTLESDQALIDETTGLARFTMNDGPQGAIQTIKITQPGMVCRARRAEFNFGGKKKALRTVRAFEEVKIEETGKKDVDYSSNPSARKTHTRYATAGYAEFDSERDLIILKEFPQVYQDRDTITGEVILVHRSSEIVEVEQSNAFTEGNES